MENRTKLSVLYYQFFIFAVLKIDTDIKNNNGFKPNAF